jgi:predicted DNA-binding protein
MSPSENIKTLLSPADKPNLESLIFKLPKEAKAYLVNHANITSTSISELMRQLIAKGIDDMDQEAHALTAKLDGADAAAQDKAAKAKAAKLAAKLGTPTN